MDPKDIEILEKLKLKQGFNKKDEIFELDRFINRFKDINQFNNPSYQEMFNLLIENRLNIINEEYLLNSNIQIFIS